MSWNKKNVLKMVYAVHWRLSDGIDRNWHFWIWNFSSDSIEKKVITGFYFIIEYGKQVK